MQAIHLRETFFAARGMDHRRKFDHVLSSGFSPGTSHSGDSEDPGQSESHRRRSARRRTVCGLRCRWEVCGSRCYGQLGLPATSTTFTASRNGRSAWRCKPPCYERVPRYGSGSASSFFSVGSRSAVSQPFSILTSGSFACSASIPLSVTLVCQT